MNLRYCAVLVLVSAAVGLAQTALPWQGASRHRVSFVPVEKDVRLEVLDWGGPGQPVVLLAGAGNTAHIYDDFADKLSAFYHVIGITRRGFGASSQPKSGYTAQRLMEDVLSVMDSLQLSKPVLVGHSVAGEELTLIGNEHSDRIAGLVYLDAGRDPTLDASEYGPLQSKLPPAMLSGPKAPSEARKSFPAFRNWRMRTLAVAFPEAELRNEFAANADGTVGASRTPASVFDAIHAGAQKRGYSKIRVPVLAFFTLPASPNEIVDFPVQLNEDERASANAVYTSLLTYIHRDEENLRSIPGARILEFPGAKHHVFLSNEGEVLSELLAFLATPR